MYFVPGVVRTPVISALRRLREEDRCEFKASLGYIVSLKPA